MPIFEFECELCNKHYEIIAKTNNSSFRCEICQEPLTQLISRTGPPQFMGSGFYETDYKRRPRRPKRNFNE